jgi:hypothetical protein
MRIDHLVVFGAGIGMLCASAVALYALAARRPAPWWIALLLIPGIPMLAVGQLWVIGVLNARMPRTRGGWLARTRQQARGQRNPRQFFFGGLPKRQAYTFLCIFYALGLLAIASAIGSFSKGTPVRNSQGCPWGLNNHGRVSCISHATYQRSQAKTETFASAILAGFFTMHCGATASELARRQAG